MPRYRLRNTAATLDFDTGVDPRSVTISQPSGQVWNGSDNLTVFMRFKAKPVSTTSFLFAIAATSGNNRRYIQQLANGNLSVVTGLLANETVIGRLQFGEWQSIALVTDSTNSRIRVYMNGMLAVDWTPFTPGTGFAPIGIGDNLAAAGGNSNAKQSDIGIWNRVLSSAEIADIHYQSIVPGNGLKGFWPLSEGVGTVATDISGNGNNGTIVGANWSTDVPFKDRQIASGRAQPRNVRSSLSFNGTSNYATLPVVPSTTAFSVMFWFKASKLVNSDRILDYGDSGPSGGFTISVSSSLGIIAQIYNSTTPVASIISPRPSIGEWNHVALTYEVNSVNFYMNGILIGTDTSATMSPASQLVTVARRSANSNNFFGGQIQDITFVNGRAITPTETERHRLLGAVPLDTTARYMLSEGAGTSLIDSTSNGNNGTLVSGTYMIDSISKPRSLVNANLVYNGGFEYAPPVNVSQTSGFTFLDGTANGSAVNRLFGYAITSWAGVFSAMYDGSEKHSGTHSLKLSTGASASRVRLDAIRQASDVSGGIPGVFAVQPNTSYTCTYWMKTNAISGSATGAFLSVAEMDAAYGSTVTSSGQAVNTTTGWTQYSFTFTTSASSRFANVRPTLIGDSGGASNLVMDTWFDDIEVKPTIPIARQIIA